MTNKKTKKELKLLLTGAKAEKQRTGSIGLKLIVHTTKGNALVPLDMLPPGINKKLVLAKLGLEIRKEAGEIKQAYIIGEAWYSERKSEKDLKDSPPPSQDPDRKRAIVIVGRNKAGKSCLGTQPFKEKNGSCRFEKPKIVAGDKKTDRIEDNLLVHLFDPTWLSSELSELDQMESNQKNKQTDPLKLASLKKDKVIH